MSAPLPPSPPMWCRLMWLVAWITASPPDASATTTTPSTSSTTEALLGSSTSLICDVAPAILGDHLSLVMWYRGEDSAPVYTWDARGPTGEHWADRALSDRAYLRDGRLTLNPVHADDEGPYRCRADFRRSPTKTTHVNLTVVVPPKEIVVTDDSNNPVRNGVTMQYAEGASATLTCIASGGRPLARVSWWRNGLLLDDSDMLSAEKQKTKNVLHIERLARRDLLTVYVCEATNAHSQPALQVPVAIDMYLRPLDVRLLGSNTPLSADITHEVRCLTHGSRPPANVTWYKDGLPLATSESRDLLAPDGNSTTSVLLLRPLASDSGMTLQCRVSNARIPHSELRDTWMLHVLYAPQVVLALGASLNASDIREGADVYFECHITANPWVHRVSWTHDGRKLVNNVTGGIIVSNQTLVLQSVSKATSGLYTCSATNTQGTRTSNHIHLDVKYEPVCGKNPIRVFGAAKQEQVSIECSVDANPSATLFRWTFNNTASSSAEVSTYTAGGAPPSTGSTLTYTPRQDSDYGTLLCWGRNTLGSQAIPCVFHVVPAGRPDPPHNCTTSNRTHHSFAVWCARGFDGGLRQRFSLLVWDSTEHLVLNVTSGALPEFTVTGLEAGRIYRAVALSYNEKGWSRTSVPLHVNTLPQPNPHEHRRSTAPAATTVTVSTGAWPYIALGLVLTLVICGVIAVLAARHRRPRCPEAEGANTGQGGTHSTEEPKVRHRPQGTSADVQHHHKSIADMPTVLEEAADPDLILLTTGDPYCQHAYGAYTISTSGGTPGCLAPCLVTGGGSGSGRQQHHIGPKRNCATQMPVRPYHVTWGPDIQIHDERPLVAPPPPPPPHPVVELCVEGIRRDVHTQTQQPPLKPKPQPGHKESSV